MNRSLANMPAAPPPDCVAVQAELSDYQDDALPSDQRDRIEQHLAVCQRCRDELALLQAIVMAMAQVRRPTPAPAMRARILAQIVSETVIERVALIRQQRDGVFSMIRHSKTEPLTLASQRPVSAATHNSEISEHLTMRRSAATLYTTTVYRRVYRS